MMLLKIKKTIHNIKRRYYEIFPVRYNTKRYSAQVAKLWTRKIEPDDFMHRLNTRLLSACEMENVVATRLGAEIMIEEDKILMENLKNNKTKG